MLRLNYHEIFDILLHEINSQNCYKSLRIVCLFEILYSHNFFRLPFSYCCAESCAHTFHCIMKISQQTWAINSDHHPIDIIHHCSRDSRIMCCHERKMHGLNILLFIEIISLYENITVHHDRSV